MSTQGDAVILTRETVQYVHHSVISRLPSGL